MKDRDLQLTEDQLRARDALRIVTVPDAEPSFRAALKGAFISGNFASGELKPSRIGVESSSAKPSWWALGARWAVAIPVAAAFLFVVVSLFNRGPQWTLASASGQGVAVIDGRPVPMNHTEELSRLLTSGARVRVPDRCVVEIASAGQMAVQFTPGTDATVPDSPGRWFHRQVRADVSAGELRITTGSRFRGARLEVLTPSANVEVSGTTVAVICDPEGTCVCVLEGRVQVGEKGGKAVAVEHGRRRFIYNDGREPESAVIRPLEATALAAFREQKRAVIN